MRVILTVATRIGETARILEFNERGETLMFIERAIENMKIELERTFIVSPKATANWQTITITLERGKE